ncbi:GlpM family protein [Dyella nitratireducens]|uniref:Membrane protein GlpM n=1 Tax=Dyella nitratireducens TaxID=1849580 RepID=A0ABQ1FU80_9GAMM|nr:GlpM family protein [Dyella nitratireducens]GGA30928.1 membrane protein GlpM [Dyella nitratireducens]GLQ42941.1 membrane protein GlpM [Dyella nitratireducens]
MNLLAKALIGALMVLLIGLLSRTRNYYIAGLLPLFPTFALMAHYIVGSERGIGDLKATILFGMWAVVPYLAYLASLYWLVDRFRLVPALLMALLVWTVTAAGAVLLWQRQ